ncbi:MAG: hypothetical protein M3Y71_17430 [Actinomycetota bacterium]|nr:hypothetical protein [Actinomycetota bacterium]
MSQDDSFEQDGSAGLTPQVDARTSSAAGSEPDPDKEAVVGHEGHEHAAGSSFAWQSHGGAAPSRGSRTSDGMSEPTRDHGPRLTGPDGEQVDADISDGGQSGQDSGSMS